MRCEETDKRIAVVRMIKIRYDSGVRFEIIWGTGDMKKRFLRGLMLIAVLLCCLTIGAYSLADAGNFSGGSDWGGGGSDWGGGSSSWTTNCRSCC